MIVYFGFRSTCEFCLNHDITDYINHVKYNHKVIITFSILIVFYFHLKWSLKDPQGQKKNQLYANDNKQINLGFGLVTVFKRLPKLGNLKRYIHF